MYLAIFSHFSIEYLVIFFNLSGNIFTIEKAIFIYDEMYIIDIEYVDIYKINPFETLTNNLNITNPKS